MIRQSWIKVLIVSGIIVGAFQVQRAEEIKQTTKTFKNRPTRPAASDRINHPLYSWLGATEETVMNQYGQDPTQVDEQRDGFDRIYVYLLSDYYPVPGTSMDNIAFYFKKDRCMKVARGYPGVLSRGGAYPLMRDVVPKSFLQIKPEIKDPAPMDQFGVSEDPFLRATWKFTKDIWQATVVNNRGRRFNRKTGEYEIGVEPLSDWNVFAITVEKLR